VTLSPFYRKQPRRPLLRKRLLPRRRPRQPLRKRLLPRRRLQPRKPPQRRRRLLPRNPRNRVEQNAVFYQLFGFIFLWIDLRCWVSLLIFSV
jgi:hypothetical protein